MKALSKYPFAFPTACVVLGLVLGLSASGVWPSVPLHAVATDSQENFAIATGSVDGQVEAIFALDFLTGDLKAAVLQPQTGRFASLFGYNVLQDFGAELRNPKFTMVTGLADFPRGAQNVQIRSVVYVAEATTGRVVCYAIPFSPAIQAQRRGQSGALVKIDAWQVREPLLSD